GGAAWTGQAGAGQEDATPYAWSPDEDEDEAGEPIGSYLQDLVSWKSGANAWVRPDSRSIEEPAGDIDMPDWLSGPGGGESWTPESTPSDAAGTAGTGTVPAAEG